MPHEEPAATVEGEISSVFAHRFVVRTAEGSISADLGPKGAKELDVEAGDRVGLTGRQTPSDLTVATSERGGDIEETEAGDSADVKWGTAKAGAA